MKPYELASEIVGLPGAMLNSSKRNPPGKEDHKIYWNACIFANEDQIWWGDIDITAKKDDLQRLANQLRTAVYVTPEQPWRWDGFKKSMKSDSGRVVEFKPAK